MRRISNPFRYQIPLSRHYVLLIPNAIVAHTTEGLLTVSIFCLRQKFHYGSTVATALKLLDFSAMVAGAGLEPATSAL